MLTHDEELKNQVRRPWTIHHSRDIAADDRLQLLRYLPFRMSLSASLRLGQGRNVGITGVTAVSFLLSAICCATNVKNPVRQPNLTVHDVERNLLEPLHAMDI